MPDQEVKDPEVKTPTIYDFLSNFPGAPDEAQIKAWNQMVPGGSVRVFTMPDGKRVFVLRAITAIELAAIQAEVSKLSSQEKQIFELQIAVAQKCTLWTSINPTGKLTDADLRVSGAGTAPTLHAVVWDKSDFIDPQVLDSLIVDL